MLTRIIKVIPRFFPNSSSNICVSYVNINNKLIYKFGKFEDQQNVKSFHQLQFMNKKIGSDQKILSDTQQKYGEASIQYVQALFKTALAYQNLPQKEQKIMKIISQSYSKIYEIIQKHPQLKQIDTISINSIQFFIGRNEYNKQNYTQSKKWIQKFLAKCKNDEIPAQIKFSVYNMMSQICTKLKLEQKKMYFNLIVQLINSNTLVKINKFGQLISLSNYAFDQLLIQDKGQVKRALDILFPKIDSSINEYMQILMPVGYLYEQLGQLQKSIQAYQRILDRRGKEQELGRKNKYKGRQAHNSYDQQYFMVIRQCSSLYYRLKNGNKYLELTKKQILLTESIEEIVGFDFIISHFMLQKIEGLYMTSSYRQADKALKQCRQRVNMINQLPDQFDGQYYKKIRQQVSKTLTQDRTQQSNQKQRHVQLLTEIIGNLQQKLNKLRNPKKK